MERRGEGFERERITPESGREIRREPVERERVTEPVMREGYIGERAPGFLPDYTHWSSVWAGFFVALATALLVGALGFALGLAGGTSAAIWAAVTLIVAYFAGGWIAARSTSVSGEMPGLVHGIAVWAVTTVALVILSAMGLAGALGAMGLGIAAPQAGTPGAGLSATQIAGWGTFVGLALGLCAAAIGGWVGGKAGHFTMHPTDRYR